jgi:hypothetical protein
MGRRDHRWTRLAAAVAAVISLAQPALAKTYTTRSGQQVDLPDRETVLDEPSISPDGHQVAYVRAAGKRQEFDDPQPSEVVVTDRSTGKSRVIVSSGAGSELYSVPVVRVTFAIDGRHLFAERTFPGTYHTIHEINLATGKERLLPPTGADIAVLRDGPWRGDLLMEVHTCYSTHSGCDYPVHVVTPAGKLVYVVPHSADGDFELQAWLTKRKWRAW